MPPVILDNIKCIMYYGIFVWITFLFKTNKRRIGCLWNLNSKIWIAKNDIFIKFSLKTHEYRLLSWPFCSFLLLPSGQVWLNTRTVIQVQVRTILPHVKNTCDWLVWVILTLLTSLFSTCTCRLNRDRQKPANGTQCLRQIARDPFHTLSHRHDNTWHGLWWTSQRHWLVWLAVIDQWYVNQHVWFHIIYSKLCSVLSMYQVWMFHNRKICWVLSYCNCAGVILPHSIFFPFNSMYELLVYKHRVELFLTL